MFPDDAVIAARRETTEELDDIDDYREYELLKFVWCKSDLDGQCDAWRTEVPGCICEVALKLNGPSCVFSGACRFAGWGPWL